MWALCKPDAGTRVVLKNILRKVYGWYEKEKLQNIGTNKLDQNKKAIMRTTGELINQKLGGK